MAAFDKIPSGHPQLDEILDYIRLGDNVVWQVSSIDEFRIFAEPFARQAVRDGRNVIYIHTFSVYLLTKGCRLGLIEILTATLKL